MRIRRALCALLAAAAGIAAATTATQADPPVTVPPDYDRIPPVFCFRVTEITPLDCDCTCKNFCIKFEVLNWTNQDAYGLRLCMNRGNRMSFPEALPQLPREKQFLLGCPPSLIGGAICPEGRTSRPDCPPHHSGRGTMEHPNDWYLSRCSQTCIEWRAGNGTPIPHRDLIGCLGGTPFGSIPAPGDIASVYKKIPGTGVHEFDCDCDGVVDSLDSAVDGGPGPYHANFPTDAEYGGEPTPGKGNVLDGFVVYVCDWDPGEFLCFNWFLTNDAGRPIGIAGAGNSFGFGTFCMARIPNIDLSCPGIFFGNTGFFSDPRDFVCNANIVRKVGADGTEHNAIFATELGAAITGPFLCPQDGQFGDNFAEPNTAVNPDSGNVLHPQICRPDTCPWDLPPKDGRIDAQDLANLLNRWGRCPQVSTDPTVLTN